MPFFLRRSTGAALLLLAGLSAACSSPPRAWHGEQDVWSAATQPALGDGEPLVEPGPDADLDDLVAWAVAASPRLRASSQRWRAALEHVVQAGSLPDPRITFGYFVEEVQTRTGPMQWRVGLSQPIPWLGELDLADEAALAQSRAAGARFVQERLALEADVRDTWAELAWVDAAAAITASHRDLLISWEEVARARYSTGLGSESDVIRAQVELGTLDDRVRTLRDLRLPVAARLNAALDRPAAAPLPVPQLDSASPLALDAEALRANLGSSSPELLALDHEVESKQAFLHLSETDAWPDAAVGVDFTRIGRGGDDAVALTAGFSLPIWRGRIRAGIARAEAELMATRADREAAQNRLASELELLLYHMRDAERRVSLYRDSLLPKGQESVAAVTTAYQAGAAGFLDLVDAERVLLEFQLAGVRAQADRDQARAALLALTGAPGSHADGASDAGDTSAARAASGADETSTTHDTDSTRTTSTETAP
ncbi:MAG: TolC family protein [Planctomycetota bacterium]|nr:MAG: TolC family protein [Planctomycetota bacterium]